MKKMVLSALMVFSASLVARASELAIYPEFAEVRESIELNGERFDWTPPADLGQFLQPNSLELDDPNVLFMSLLPPTLSLLEMFEGKEVKVWFDDQYVLATVVNAKVGMFRIDGSYIQIANPQVQYPSIEGWRIAATYSWQRNPVPRKATLQYRTSGVHWNQTRYTLGFNQNQASSSQANLIGWAEISNESSVQYTAAKATLFAGFTPIESSDGLKLQRERTQAILTTRPVATKPMPISQVSSLGEVGGLQKFEYPSKFELAGRSTLNLPFVRTQPMVKRVLEYRNEFIANANLDTTLFRTYRFKTEQVLPQGVITIRENNQLVGQAQIADTAIGSSLTLNLGKDFDIKMQRSAQLLKRTKTRSQILTKYKIVFRVKNIKTRDVTARLNEVLCTDWKLNAIASQGFIFSNAGFELERQVKAGQTLTATLTATRIEKIVRSNSGIVVSPLPIRC
jgi:hypothetical protein